MERFSTLDIILATTGFALVVIIGTWAIWEASLAWAIVYLMGSLFGLLVIQSYLFCTKCPYCGKGCYLPNGKLAGLMFRSKKPEKHTPLELLAGPVAVVFAVFVPQYWLFKNLVLLVFFWLVVLAVLINVVVRFCPRCLNFNCPANRVPQEIRQRFEEREDV